MRNYLRTAVLAVALLLAASIGASNVFAAACTCDAGGVSTSGAAVLGEVVGCSSSSTACTVTIPGGAYLHHLEFQNDCASDNYVQWNGVVAVAGQAIDIPTGQDKTYDIINGAAAIAPPGTTTGSGLIPNVGGAISLLGGGTCTLTFSIFAY